jgi:hypothetical protein
MDDHGEAKSEGGGEMSHDHMKKKMVVEVKPHPHYVPGRCNLQPATCNVSMK